MTHINEKQKTTKYMLLYEKLRQMILSGSYSYGSKLPSKRILSEENGISLISVEHSLEMLADEGYIETRERKGYFVIYREDEGFTNSIGSAFYTVPSEASDEVDLFPFSLYARTMRKVLSQYDQQIFTRCPGEGSVKLRQAIAGYLGRSRNMMVPYERIVIGSGAEYLYGLILQMLGMERAYAIEKPSYEKIEQIYNAHGIYPESLPLGKGGIISSNLASSSAEVLHVSPFRSFPSGITASAAKRAEYIKWASSNGRIIIEDDFESEFSVLSKPEDTLFALSEDDNVIYINTFSKTIAPSIRIGYMILPEKLMGLFQTKVGFYSCTVPSYEQYVLAEFMDSGEFERHINRVRRQKRRSSKQNKKS